MDKSRRYLEGVVIKAISFYNGFLNGKEINIEGINSYDLEAIILLVLGFYDRVFNLDFKDYRYENDLGELSNLENLVDFLFEKLQKVEKSD
jgi:hypothetical protein